MSLFLVFYFSLLVFFLMTLLTLGIRGTGPGEILFLIKA